LAPTILAVDEAPNRADGEGTKKRRYCLCNLPGRNANAIAGCNAGRAQERRKPGGALADLAERFGSEPPQREAHDQPQLLDSNSNKAKFQFVASGASNIATRSGTVHAVPWVN
jgi:hypothetical protein